jgi:hypothetical protein
MTQLLKRGPWNLFGFVIRGGFVLRAEEEKTVKKILQLPFKIGFSFDSNFHIVAFPFLLCVVET